MKTLMTASTLALAAIAGTANAEAHTDMTQMTSMELAEMAPQLIRSRDITGGPIYTLNAADDEGWDSNVMYDDVGTDWNEIGEIEDIVLSADGQMVGIVAEVGGFLDIGDKHVLISVDDVNLSPLDDGTYIYVTWMNEEELESMQGVDEGPWD